MAQESQNDVRTQLLELLLDKVEQDQYPSSTMLDLIEELVSPDEVEEYAGVLMAKLEGETYPSNSLIRRVMALR
ncbi:hypothetical protein [Nocardioides euryhalodurans]|uniref:Uncharacterized protein n=1 Tax=Nocardioides euryhalodurans TaxID=2518370 RepID=A0A4P7GNE8_9ACTN|nr:hypothetical protein [Nocardioides euryhalodurans]QBR93301.1 hypothetical protein EXE57_14285 [Nocardioides euryhalodurans]